MSTPTKADQIRDAVQNRYGAIARARGTGSQGCCSIPVGSTVTTVEATDIGYTDQDVVVGGEANLGLGCGNPLALAAVEPGMTVVDLGSGAGFDAFLVRERVGETGRVIGVDMTDDMLELARTNAAKRGVANVDFRKGLIETMPVEDGIADLVISNCVVNLSPDKFAVFREIARVLKPGGQFWISDIVLLKPLPSAIVDDVNAYCGCVAGASLISDYLSLAMEAGLTDIAVPRITSGASLLEAMQPALVDLNKQVKLTPEEFANAARSVVSANFHGRKPAEAPRSKPVVKKGESACCAPGCCN